MKLLPQIAWLDNKMTTIANELKFETKFVSFFNVYTDMSSAFDEFHTSVLSYVDNVEQFNETLREFTSRYERSNYEFKLVDKALTSLGIVKSLTDAFKELTLNYETNSVGPTINKLNMAPVTSSTNKLIFEFYLMIMMRVYEGFSMLELCYQLQSNLPGCK